MDIIRISISNSTLGNTGYFMYNRLSVMMVATIDSLSDLFICIWLASNRLFQQ